MKSILDIDDNTSLLKLRGSDLQEFLVFLDDYDIKYRDQLNFEEKDTFGIEIEYEKINKNKHKKMEVLEYSGAFPSWKFVFDSSLYHGCEVDSPILKDTKEAWQGLKDICEHLRKYSIIWYNCGGHIHISATSLGEDLKVWINFLKLWQTYENIIFRFSYGEYLTPRPRIIRFAYPISNELEKILTKENLDSCVDPYSIIWSSLFDLEKDNAVNLNHIEDLKKNQYGNTIEFRCPNGTLNPIVWQNNINLFMHLLMYSRSLNYNKDIVDNRYNINKEKYFRGLEAIDLIRIYNEIYLEQSLELADMLFDNNLDKINFLKQYLKSFEVGTKNLQKSKTFSKSLKRGL